VLHDLTLPPVSEATISLSIPPGDALNERGSCRTKGSMKLQASTTESWWPSPFGADDRIGMLNHVDDAKRLPALGLVRSGRL